MFEMLHAKPASVNVDLLACNSCPKLIFKMMPEHSVEQIYDGINVKDMLKQEHMTGIAVQTNSLRVQYSGTRAFVDSDPCTAARVGASESGSLAYPVENTPMDGIHYPTEWNPAPRPAGYTSTGHNVEMSHYQPESVGPSHEPFLQSSTTGTFCVIPDCYAHHASSSNYDRQSLPGVDGEFVDLTIGNGRGPYKRKSPGIPTVCERGTSSRYNSGGGSSDHSSNLWQEKPSMESQHLPWDQVAGTSSFRGNNAIVGSESSLRNVRSRPALDLEANLARTHLYGNPPHHPYSASAAMDLSRPMDIPMQSSNGTDWNHIHVSPPPPPPPHGRVPQITDVSRLSHETNHFPVTTTAVAAAAAASVEHGGYNHEFFPSRNTVVSQNPHAASNQSARGIRSSYSQRSSPSFRASSSNLRLGHMATSDDGLQLIAESHSSRHPRPFSTIGWRNNERNGRLRMSSERYRSLSDEAGIRERLVSEGLMIVDRSSLYGSRGLFDQHRDMRLDIDNMSYEELLALGERIGTVNTGLSENSISKCLTESIYCSSSDQNQEEGTCVICLEEYNNMDDVGTLKSCGHDYHVECIHKWLSMKNSCPICKGPALDDSGKEN
ncbi:Zinc finger, RING-type [Dillenia turbinata]|uniref:RING-type E3 ubiquitin transferase n=1 Tax=Dillenia turbinata TaxID=194707 RepID=A0AAN8ZQB3_9MAGN